MPRSFMRSFSEKPAFLTNRLSISLFTFFTILLLLNVGSFCQSGKTPVKTKPKVPAAIPLPPAEISETEWNELVKSFAAEDWDQTVLLSSSFLKKFKTDNEKRELAQIRYFYLFSLAGKVSQSKMTFDQLKTLSVSLIGQKFLMPGRKVLADCKKALNYICAMKQYYRTWRVTATNREFTAIHAFEYIQLPEKVDTALYPDKEVVLGGKLLKIEFNPKQEVSWIMRLYFTALISDSREHDDGKVLDK